MNVFDLMAKLSLDTSDYTKGLDEASKATESWKDKVASAGKNMAKATGVVTMLAGGAYKLAKSTADNADQIDKMSQKLGMSTRAYQEWGYVMELSGTSIDSMGAGMKTLTTKMDDAINGGEDAINMFKQVGVSLADLQSMSREDIFAKVVTGFQQMDDTAQRAMLATDLLGKSGTELTPLFNTTAEATQGMIKQLNDMGGVMSEDAIQSGAQLGDSLEAMQKGFQSAAASLGTALIPFINDFLDKINGFIASGGLQKIIQLFIDWTPAIAAVAATYATLKTAMAINDMIQAFIIVVGGATKAFAGLNAVMLANPIVLIIGLIAALVAAFVVLWKKNDDFRNFFVEAWNNIKEVFFQIGTELVEFITEDIPKGFQELIDFIASIPRRALEWGRDLIDNFINGIKERFENLKEKIKDVAGAIKDFLGFSEPEKGPLSNFHTYAPDMMDLFAKGIRDNEDVVKNQIAKSFDFGTIGTFDYGTASYSSAPSVSSATSNNATPQNVQVNVTLEGDAKKLFNVIRDENKKYEMTTGLKVLGV